METNQKYLQFFKKHHPQWYICSLSLGNLCLGGLYTYLHRDKLIYHLITKMIHIWGITE